MPSGKRRRAAAASAKATEEPTTSSAEEPAAESVDGQAAEAVEQPSESEDSAASEQPAEETSPVAEDETEPSGKKRRRWNVLRRRKKEASTAEVATPVEDESVTPTTAEPVRDEPASDEPVGDEAVGVASKADDETTAETTEAEPKPESEGETTPEEASEEAPILVPHRPAGKKLKIAAAVAAVLFVGGGAFLGATAQPVIANRALVENKLTIARTAADAITTLWSYTPENMDSLADRSAKYLSGDFADQYRKFIDSIVATNKQAQVTNTTSVLGTAVESVNDNEASAIVYTNSIATSPVSKNIPSLRYLSYRLEMKRERSDWRITRMTTITTLDLTPQL